MDKYDASDKARDIIFAVADKWKWIKEKFRRESMPSIKPRGDSLTGSQVAQILNEYWKPFDGTGTRLLWNNEEKHETD